MITRSAFRPAWWLPGPHLQTLYPSLFRSRNIPPLRRERIELPDGDFVDLDWTPQTDGLCVLILHGLEGSIDSHYASGMLNTLANNGHTAGLMYFRGRSGESNRLPRSYHSGDTGDLDFVMQHVSRLHPEKSIAVIAYSLGGNVLLKWLGEQGDKAIPVTAITLSVPFDLNSAALRLEQGMSRIYQQHLLQRLRESVKKKASTHPMPFPTDRLEELRTFREFDHAITAPLHGFEGVDDYYQQSSCKPFLKHIAIPTLMLQARDDPFLPESALPVEGDLNELVTLELSRRGGHVGYVSGWNPLQPVFWSEQRVLQHLSEFH
jgi:predicted alpha/beta-fold hydrolase